MVQPIMPDPRKRSTRERFVRATLWMIEHAADAVGHLSLPPLDRLYLTLRHVQKFRRWPRTRHPRTFNEHLLRYKLANRHNLLFSRLADKVAVKGYVADHIGSDHVIPTLWHGADPAGIPFDTLTQPYVIKSSHGSGQILLIRDPAAVNRPSVIETARDWLREPFGIETREYHYAGIPRQILIEPFLDAGGDAPDDYKFFCFGGRVKAIQVDSGRFHGHHRTLLDTGWQPFDCRYVFPRPDASPTRPARLPEMIRIAQALAPPIPLVRVDLYDLPTRVMFGELTFMPEGGNGRFYPDSYDWTFGSMWPTGTD